MEGIGSLFKICKFPFKPGPEFMTYVLKNIRFQSSTGIRQTRRI